ncbi:VOC family protein [Rhodoferax sp. GW822-FHT02A01]|uniref:VOC family protein n=1 Tax=Rhodoferax sp. GW822-FHT02A01 TaxID=3141537 RepID=UPI00315C798B
MIESPCTIHIPVADLQIAERWYSKAFNASPSYSNEEGVFYDIGGCELMLRLSHSKEQDGIGIYWSAEDIQEEFKRISEFAEVKSHPTTPNAFEQSVAEFLDPFGNIFGIRAKDLKGEKNARIRRAAERAALKNVRAAVDQFMAAEEKQKEVNKRVFWIFSTVLLVLISAFASSHFFGKPKERHPGEVTNPADFLGKKPK